MKKEKRKLTEEEMKDILSVITHNKCLPRDTAISIVKNERKNLKGQLEKVEVYPSIIPELKRTIGENYQKTLVQAGESVGVLMAQSIGERQTQMTLNSVDWKERVLYIKDGKAKVEPIGQMIDNLLIENKDKIQNVQKNQTEYLELPDGYFIPSGDENGMNEWLKIEAVTRHLPTGELVKITTQSGREVSASQCKSFLVWNGEKFEAKNGSDVKIGDIVPVSKKLQRFREGKKFLDIGEIFPVEYLHFDKDLFIYLHNFSKFVSHIPDKFHLDENFGFITGVYLSNGYVTETFTCISNNDEKVRKRITIWCDKYNISYILDTESLKINSVILTKLLLHLCDTGSANKSVPEIAYTANDDFIKGMIDGYISGDGVVCKKSGSITVSSDSEKLIHGISFLLSYYEIFGRFGKNNIEGKNIKPIFTLTISNEFSQEFAFQFTLTDDRKQEKLQNITLVKKYKFAEEYPNDRDVYFDEISNIDFVEATNGVVYDFTVEKTRNFNLACSLVLRDTFHSTGISAKTVVTGVPRFSELLNATKDPKASSCNVFFTKNNTTTISDLRKSINHTMTCLNMKDISTSITIHKKKEPEIWYESFKILYNDNFSKHECCISFTFDMEKLYEYSLDFQKIAESIENEYDDLLCVYSPIHLNRFDIFVDVTNISLPTSRLMFINSENANYIYMDEVVIPNVSNINLCGIEGVKNIFYQKEPKSEKWMVETEGSNFKKILSHPDVDTINTISNNMWEIYTVLGIEAAREFLIEEFLNVVLSDGTYINTRHVMILVDIMTFYGTIISVSRYGMKKADSGPLCRASFEESLDNFLNAGIYGEVESTKGVSASIICGKMSSIGTGLVNLQLDVEKLKGKPKIIVNVNEKV